MNPGSSPHVPIGKHFLQKDRISVSQLEEALEYKSQHGLKLGQALVALEYVTETELVEALRHQGKLFCINLTAGIIDQQVAMKLGEKKSRRFRALAINRIADHTTVVMEDPSDVYAIDEMGRSLDSRIVPVFAEPTKIHDGIDFVFTSEVMKLGMGRVSSLQNPPAEPPTEEEVPEEVQAPEEAAQRVAEPREPKEIQEPEAPELAPEQARAFLEEEPTAPAPAPVPEPAAEAQPAPSSHELGARRRPVHARARAREDLDKPAVKLVRSILEEGFGQGVSDIHLEPRKDDFVFRFRREGTLSERRSVPKSWSRAILSRVKVLANLDISQRMLPQEGRAQLNHDGKRLELLVTTMPTIHGESAVLRVLSGGRDRKGLFELDLDKSQLEELDGILTCRDGLFIASGPFASGKTTTLYAILDRFAGPDRKTVALEDPVEIEMPGVTQVNIHPRVGLGYARALRAVLRQDPDVILVGALPDMETAEIAVQASQTGRIVLSTMHTAGAMETIQRLIDMGLETYLVAEALRGVVAQRLLRRLCQECKKPVKPEPSVLARLGLEGDRSEYFEGEGCEACHGTGFDGRVGAYEILSLGQPLAGLVQDNAGVKALLDAAVEEGFVTLREDALRKAREGLTTVQEVLIATNRG